MCFGSLQKELKVLDPALVIFKVQLMKYYNVYIYYNVYYNMYLIYNIRYYPHGRGVGAR